MPLKIKSGKYGQAIGMLIRRGGGFQTRFLETLIVNAEQKRVLEEAGLVEANGTPKKAARPSEAVKDFVTTIQVYANPIETTNLFFSRLKQILKTAGEIEQQEILISRFDYVG